LWCNNQKHFKHGLSSIRATGAEIRPVKGLSKNWTLLSFCELDKCAVEHVFGSIHGFGVSQGLGCGLGCGDIKGIKGKGKGKN
jgi:hypothetical protein